MSYSVEDQEERCRELCTKVGYQVGPVYYDDGISAYRSLKHRPGYQEMREGIRSGAFDVLVFDRQDRLARDQIETMDLIVDTARNGREWHSARDGVVDLTDPFQVMIAVYRGGEAQGYSAAVSSSLKRYNASARARGASPVAGPKPFGWESDRVTVCEEQAYLIQQGTQMILENKSLHQVVLAWRASEVKPPRAAAWTRISVMKTLSRWRNAGVLSHMDEPENDADGARRLGAWDAIVSVQDLEAVRAILTARTGEKRTVNRLCSGIARCDCGEYLIGSGSRTGPAYMCSARIRGVARPGRHAGIKAETLDELVRSEVVARYFAPELVTSEDEAEKVANVAALHAKLAQIRGEAERLTRLYLKGKVNDAVHDKLQAELEASAADLTVQLNRAASASAHVRMLTEARENFFGADLTSKDARIELGERFDCMSLDDRRGLVRALLGLTVRPSTGPKDIGAHRVSVDWL